jgi:uncharacterized damage-inducible protein DinB
MSLGQLALHVATVPGGVAELAMQDMRRRRISVQPEALRPPSSCRRSTASVARRRQLLGGADDATMGKTWRLMNGGREILAMPRAAFLRAIMLNHWYHHRGQLLVYLRLLNLSVPSVYGPTRDENPFLSQ